MNTQMRAVPNTPDAARGYACSPYFEYEKLGKRLFDMRTALGIHPEQVAKRMASTFRSAIDGNRIRQIENAEGANPTPATVVQLCHIYRVPAKDVLEPRWLEKRQPQRPKPEWNGPTRRRRVVVPPAAELSEAPRRPGKLTLSGCGPKEKTMPEAPRPRAKAKEKVAVRKSPPTILRLPLEAVVGKVFNQKTDWELMRSSFRQASGIAGLPRAELGIDVDLLEAFVEGENNITPQQFHVVLGKLQTELRRLHDDPGEEIDPDAYSFRPIDFLKKSWLEEPRPDSRVVAEDWDISPEALKHRNELERRANMNPFDLIF